MRNTGTRDASTGREAARGMRRRLVVLPPSPEREMRGKTTQRNTPPAHSHKTEPSQNNGHSLDSGVNTFMANSSLPVFRVLRVMPAEPKEQRKRFLRLPGSWHPSLRSREREMRQRAPFPAAFWHPGRFRCPVPHPADWKILWKRLLPLPVFLHPRLLRRLPHHWVGRKE